MIASQGPVLVRRAAGLVHLLKAGDSLQWGDIVEVPQGSLARVSLGDRVTVTLRELSRLELRQERRANRLSNRVNPASRPGTRAAVASIRG